MKKLILFFVLCLALPAYAQKNLIPIVKTTFSKQTARAVAGQQTLRRLGKVPLGTPTAVKGVLSSSDLMPSTKTNPLVPFKESIPPSVLEPIGLPENLKAQKLIVANNAVLNELNKLQEEDKNTMQASLFDIFLDNSQFALQNNRLVLSFRKRCATQRQWLRQLPNQGQDALEFVPFSQDIMDQLAEKISQNSMIFLGESHFMIQVLQKMPQLMTALRNQNPGRRIVMFTEFIDLPQLPAGSQQGKSMYSYYRENNKLNAPSLTQQDLKNPEKVRYARKMFADLLQNDLEIYPLEDRELIQFIKQERPASQVRKGDIDALSVSMRNKSWARIIETKMTEVRKTDPDALFVIYAGSGHLSWLMPNALPKFFAKEKSCVVEITEGSASNDNILESVWGQNHPFFQKYGLFFWKEPEARLLGKNTGVDYALVFPESDWRLGE